MDSIIAGSAAFVCSIALMLHVRYRRPSPRTTLLMVGASGLLLLLGILIFFAPETYGALWSSVLPASVSPWLITIGLIILALRLVQLTLRVRRAA